MSTRNNPGGDTHSGVGRQTDDTTPGGAAGMSAHSPDESLSIRQSLDGNEDDDLGAATEEQMLSRAARSTPSMNDVRSDVGNGPNGEPR